MSVRRMVPTVDVTNPGRYAPRAATPVVGVFASPCACLDSAIIRLSVVQPIPMTHQVETAMPTVNAGFK